ncbi:class I SAM-dependent methyltransferase [Sporolactobacillus sp. THM7-7]|nr:class I SAM-dependent methyltransferase [Sporolactobacillus sp. THM7-7]
MTIFAELSPRLYHWIVRPSGFTRKHIHSNLQEHFIYTGKTVLDFGAGTGANCSVFDCEYYVGVDLDRERVQFARQKYPEYTFYPLKSYRLPVDSQSVDYIIIIAVLHHIAHGDILRYLDEFKRVLKKDGTILVLEPYLNQHKPLANRLMSWLDKGKYIRDDQGYINFFRTAGYECRVLKHFTKGLIYNELFFSARKGSGTEEKEREAYEGIGKVE